MSLTKGLFQQSETDTQEITCMSQAQNSPHSYSPQWHNFLRLLKDQNNCLPLHFCVHDLGKIQYLVAFSPSVRSFFVPKNESVFSVLQTSHGQPIPPHHGRPPVFPVRHRPALPSSGPRTPHCFPKERPMITTALPLQTPPTPHSPWTPRPARQFGPWVPGELPGSGACWTSISSHPPPRPNPLLI